VPQGFRWVNSDAEQSVLSYLRLGEESDAPVLVVCNFTPVERNNFRIGVPKAGRWEEVLNTDSALYGGGNRGNLGGLEAEAIQSDGFEASIAMTLPPLSVVIFTPEA
jgi:1,4-alpha-glucan branching enzyme